MHQAFSMGGREIYMYAKQSPMPREFATFVPPKELLHLAVSAVPAVSDNWLGRVKKGSNPVAALIRADACRSSWAAGRLSGGQQPSRDTATLSMAKRL
ncbi:hypothetical protein [Kitasatospora sp. Ki12]